MGNVRWQGRSFSMWASSSDVMCWIFASTFTSCYISFLRMKFFYFIGILPCSYSEKQAKHRSVSKQTSLFYPCHNEKPFFTRFSLRSFVPCETLSEGVKTIFYGNGFHMGMAALYRVFRFLFFLLLLENYIV